MKKNVIKQIKFLLVLLGFFTLNSNYTYSQNNFQTAFQCKIVDKNFDVVWTNAIKFGAINEVDFKCLNKESGLINFEMDLNKLDTQNINLSNFVTDNNISSFVKNSNQQSARVNVYLLIRNVDGNLQVFINSNIEAKYLVKNKIGKSVNIELKALKLNSNGILEHIIFDKLNQ